MRARRAGAPACALAPRGRPGYLRGRYLLAQPVPAAARPRPLPSQRRAAPRPQHRQPADPGPPDASLAPPQPCRPEGEGLPGAQPTPAPSRRPIGRRRPVLRFPSYPARPSPPPAPTSSALPVFAPFCGLSHSPRSRSSLSHWSAAASTIGPRYLSISWESLAPPVTRRLWPHWVQEEG